MAGIKIIAHTIYMCLDLWQVRNEALVANRKILQCISERNDFLLTSDVILGEDRSATIERNPKPKPLAAAKQLSPHTQTNDYEYGLQW